MKDFIIILASSTLSSTIFSCLFYWLNNSKLGLFKSIQRKIDTLNEKKKRNLNIFTNILLIIIGLFCLTNNINFFVTGLILGIIIAFNLVCFRELENTFKTDNKDHQNP
ncbi:MAG: hypothetical protein KH200_04955 [Clostridium sp.]|uniref:hypothetical protein n=1 Tax=Clostridium TaxID=1485 RepID=UPI0012B782BC|nr:MULTISPECIES: hypothetical protein [Clostridium]MBS6887247.1 hypothetical protein [Clostridium sp.]